MNRAKVRKFEVNAVRVAVPLVLAFERGGVQLPELRTQLADLGGSIAADRAASERIGADVEILRQDDLFPGPIEPWHRSEHATLGGCVLRVRYGFLCGGQPVHRRGQRQDGDRLGFFDVSFRQGTHRGALMSTRTVHAVIAHCIRTFHARVIRRTSR